MFYVPKSVLLQKPLSIFVVIQCISKKRRQPVIIATVFQSLDNLMQHSEDNPNQIRLLAQTLTDGGVMDELINEELETFNSRWRELHEEV